MKHAVARLVGLSAGVFITNAAMATHHTKVEAASASPGLTLGGPTDGRPVTAKDVAGKKFCWNDGHWAYFMPEGGYMNDRRDYFKKSPAHWHVLADGVIKVGDSERQAEVLPNGQLHEHWYALAHGKEHGTHSHDRDVWGSVCN
jgi:hypothetical protein